jgi:hypothetical protein
MDGGNNMFNWFKKRVKTHNRATTANEFVNSVKPKVEKAAKATTKTEKEIATEKGEPYVSMLRMDIDPNNLHQGAFELDWNEIFVSRLVKAGYMIKREDTDAEIVDRWFQNVCRHVVMETWEQEQAIRTSGAQYVNARDIGGGRTEIS